ncbi:MAG TPA: hypothetical protein VJP80_04870 [Candidatus Saccharimonadales bacterium]|nr:hypothetical protein [Candidatus Saccharimonadales bacterium]
MREASWFERRDLSVRAQKEYCARVLGDLASGEGGIRWVTSSHAATDAEVAVGFGRTTYNDALFIMQSGLPAEGTLINPDARLFDRGEFVAFLYGLKDGEFGSGETLGAT